MTRTAWLSERLAEMRGRALPVAPVPFGLGVGIYFGLPVEPSLLAWIMLGSVALVLAIATVVLWRSPLSGLGYLTLLPLLVALGLGAGGLRTWRVAAPVLDFRYYGPVEGRVIEIDRSTSQAVRLTLDRVRLDDVSPAKMPDKVRVSLHGQQGFVDPEPGMRVAMTAWLGPPEGPVEPGGFDFRRYAWFEGLGALGYTRTPVLELAPAGGIDQLSLATRALRAKIASGVQAALPGLPGQFATAITTGDRSSMPEEALLALRQSNLAHLLAISGLHMGLLTGFVYLLLRRVTALVPAITSRWRSHKAAAIGALIAGAFYLALSGGNVPTLRAFIMVAVMFGAVLLDRRAISLRAVAVAALLILAVQPEALTQAGFQMSFSATTGLVATYGALRNWRGPRLPRWLSWPAGVLTTSAIAGLATAPFAAAAFNQVSYYGLIANFLAVPVMGTLVMPLAVVAAILWPFGLSGIALWLMGWPIRWIMAVAFFTSGREGAVGHVVTPDPAVVPLLALGGLAVVLMRGRWRGIGLVPILAAFALWAMTERPQVLVSPGGGLVGVMTPEGRALSKPKGDGFAADTWLENDGAPVPQPEAAARAGFVGGKGELEVQLGHVALVQLTGQGAAEHAPAACQSAAIVIVTAEVDPIPRGCDLYDRTRLEQTGALAIRHDHDGGGITIETAAARAGDRPWTRD